MENRNLHEPRNIIGARTRDVATKPKYFRNEMFRYITLGTKRSGRRFIVAKLERVEIKLRASRQT